MSVKMLKLRMRKSNGRIGVRESTSDSWTDGYKSNVLFATNKEPGRALEGNGG